jgi:transposase-like protein
MIYKELVSSAHRFIEFEYPVSDDELKLRESEYEILSPKKFNTKRTKEAFSPFRFSFQGKVHELYLNKCTNPLCKNYGMPQEKFEIKGLSSRYRLSSKSQDSVIRCNEEKVDSKSPPTGKCTTRALSNWSIAEEIDRLVRINQVKPVEVVYEYHKDGCSVSAHTPKTAPQSFYKRGTNVAKSQKYQCKTCKKITSVRPNKRQNVTFNQKKNEILPLLADLIVNKVPINRSCEILKIGKGTYYHKLEWLYRCCLEFLETHETKAFQKKEFPELWITTDKLHYALNNVPKKGQGKSWGEVYEDKQMMTFLLASADKNSRYVFRSDICYDWDVSLDDVIDHTHRFKDDHLAIYHQRFARFGEYGTAPMKPTANDTQSMAEYREELRHFELRRNYVEGLHVGQTYTAIAHFWLIRQMLNTDRWRFISDSDESLKKSIFSVFNEEIRSKMAHYFLCMTDKNLTRGQARSAYHSAIGSLKAWSEANGYEPKNLEMMAIWYLEDQLKHHKFQERHVAPNGEVYYTQLKNRIDHPIPSLDRGYRKLDVLTDLNHLNENSLAKVLIDVNDNAVNAFFQTVRRRISMLERPLTTARGDGKSYIYANFNPKYAQMAITILRTYYNFCLTYKTGKKEQTPAQAMGITDKSYEWYDIIYKR